jgi:hypothetical protein
MTHSAIADAIADLERTVDAHGRGCPCELWIARASLATIRAAAGITATHRDAFLGAAEAAGLYVPAATPGWTLEPTDTLCMHRIEYGCCPAGCDRHLNED